MDATTATQTQIPVSSSTMTEVPLSSSGVETIEEIQNLPTDSGDATNKTKRDSLKGFFRRKKNDQVAENVSNSLESPRPDSSSITETSKPKSNSLGKRFPRIGRIASTNTPKREIEVKIESTDSMDSRKGFKNTLSNYWNSIFKKSQKDDESKSAEIEVDVLANVEPELNIEIKNAAGKAINQNITTASPGQIPIRDMKIADIKDYRGVCYEEDNKSRTICPICEGGEEKFRYCTKYDEEIKYLSLQQDSLGSPIKNEYE